MEKIASQAIEMLQHYYIVFLNKERKIELYAAECHNQDICEYEPEHTFETWEEALVFAKEEADFEDFNLPS